MLELLGVVVENVPMPANATECGRLPTADLGDPAVAVTAAVTGAPVTDPTQSGIAIEMQSGLHPQYYIIAHPCVPVTQKPASQLRAM